jgi:C-terminal processing protease CtpA/Prc
VSEGVRILEVIEQCPAHQAGLLEGDVILRIDGLDVSGPETLRELMVDKKPGDSTKLEISRQGEIQVIQIQLGSRVRFEQQMLAMERERFQQKQIRAQIRMLEEMLSNMNESLQIPVGRPADSSPPVKRTDSNSP